MISVSKEVLDTLGKRFQRFQPWSSLPYRVILARNLSKEDRNKTFEFLEDISFEEGWASLTHKYYPGDPADDSINHHVALMYEPYFDDSGELKGLFSGRTITMHSGTDTGDVKKSLVERCVIEKTCMQLLLQESQTDILETLYRAFLSWFDSLEWNGLIWRQCPIPPLRGSQKFRLGPDIETKHTGSTKMYIKREQTPIVDRLWNLYKDRFRTETPRVLLHPVHGRDQSKLQFMVFDRSRESEWEYLTSELLELLGPYQHYEKDSFVAVAFQGDSYKVKGFVSVSRQDKECKLLTRYWIDTLDYISDDVAGVLLGLLFIAAKEGEGFKRPPIPSYGPVLVVSVAFAHEVFFSTLEFKNSKTKKKNKNFLTMQVNTSVFIEKCSSYSLHYIPINKQPWSLDHYNMGNNELLMSPERLKSCITKHGSFVVATADPKAKKRFCICNFREDLDTKEKTLQVLEYFSTQFYRFRYTRPDLPAIKLESKDAYVAIAMKKTIFPEAKNLVVCFSFERPDDKNGGFATLTSFAFFECHGPDEKARSATLLGFVTSQNFKTWYNGNTEEDALEFIRTNMSWYFEELRVSSSSFSSSYSVDLESLNRDQDSRLVTPWQVPAVALPCQVSFKPLTLPRTVSRPMPYKRFMLYVLDKFEASSFDVPLESLHENPEVYVICRSEKVLALFVHEEKNQTLYCAYLGGLLAETLIVRLVQIADEHAKSPRWILNKGVNVTNALLFLSHYEVKGSFQAFLLDNGRDLWSQSRLTSDRPLRLFSIQNNEVTSLNPKKRDALQMETLELGPEEEQGPAINERLVTTGTLHSLLLSFFWLGLLGLFSISVISLVFGFRDLDYSGSPRNGGCLESSSKMRLSLPAWIIVSGFVGLLQSVSFGLNSQAKVFLFLRNLPWLFALIWSILGLAFYSHCKVDKGTKGADDFKIMLSSVIIEFAEIGRAHV